MFIALLPYFEQNALYDVITSIPNTVPWQNTFNATNFPTLSGADQIPYRAKLADLLCPSDAAGTIVAAGDIGRTNYRVCGGDWPAAWVRANADGSFNQDGNGTAREERARGVFSPVIQRTLAIPDGTSNTIGLSERVMTTAGNITSVKAGFAINQPAFVSHTYSVTAALTANPQGCMLLRGENNTYKPEANAGTLNAASHGGLWWPDGSPFYAVFTTIMPPNAPACFSMADDGMHRGRLMAGPSSNHTGGVNITLMDGAVRFVNESVDIGNDFGSSPVQSGKSPYGVWGAIGSREGGESASL